MKKIIAILLVAVLALSLTACSKSVSLDKEEIIFTAAGETQQLTADSKKELTWSSSDESVATVDRNGLVTAVAPGAATITVTLGDNVTDVCAVNCDWSVFVDLPLFYETVYAELYPLDADGYPTGPHATDLMGEESGMTAEDAAMMLEMYYPGLSAIEANQIHVYIPGMSFSAYEVVLMELANESDIETVKGILQSRIDMQAEGGAWYPEAIEGWLNNARIVTNGSYIMMAVGADCDTFVDAFNAQF